MQPRVLTGNIKVHLRCPRGEEPIMFPFWMIDLSGQGRRRRRDTSSSVSRKRARRRDRRHCRRRSSSESDRRGRKRERSRDAPQASASSSSLPLGGAPQGYAWVQVPVNAQGSLPCLACRSRRKQRSLRQKKRHGTGLGRSRPHGREESPGRRGPPKAGTSG